MSNIINSLATQAMSLGPNDLEQVATNAMPEEVSGNMVSDFTKELLAKVDETQNLASQIKVNSTTQMSAADMLNRQSNLEQYVVNITLLSKEASMAAKSIDTLVTKTQ